MVEAVGREDWCGSVEGGGRVEVLLVAEVVVEREPVAEAEAASVRRCEMWLRKGLRRTVEAEEVVLGGLDGGAMMMGLWGL